MLPPPEAPRRVAANAATRARSRRMPRPPAGPGTRAGRRAGRRATGRSPGLPLRFPPERSDDLQFPLHGAEGAAETQGDLGVGPPLHAADGDGPKVVVGEVLEQI